MRRTLPEQSVGRGRDHARVDADLAAAVHKFEVLPKIK